MAHVRLFDERGQRMLADLAFFVALATPDGTFCLVYIKATNGARIVPS